MAKSFLLKPDDVQRRLDKRYNNNHTKWLEGKGNWPLEMPLGMPTEREALENVQSVQEWQKQWYEWQGTGEIKWVDKRWSKLGIQKLPERLIFDNPLGIARWIGKEKEWDQAAIRYALMLKKWPVLSSVLSKYLKILVDFESEDFRKLISVLEWFEKSPNSGLYIRQLPIEGIHTKWIINRKSLVSDLLRAIRGCKETKDFYQVTGTRSVPDLVRFKILDGELRNMMGGLSDISATIEDVADMCLPIERVYIVENLQTGLAFNDIKGSVVFMKQGYAVDLYSKITWLNRVPIYYWGDMDTHGFAILNRLRSYFPKATSILMDETTFLKNEKFCVKEDKPIINSSLNLLTVEENDLYHDLCNNRWGEKLRLEQERIPWDYAWEVILSVTI